MHKVLITEHPPRVCLLAQETQKNNTATHCNTLQHTSTHCNTLQHTATHCNTLSQSNAHTQCFLRTGNTHTYCNALDALSLRVAACCSMLQRVAARCSVLQYNLRTRHTHTHKHTQALCLSYTSVCAHVCVHESVYMGWLRLGSFKL